MDYEELILRRQEELENLLEYCDCECDYCPYAREYPTRYFYEEPKRYCSIREDY